MRKSREMCIAADEYTSIKGEVQSATSGNNIKSDTQLDFLRIVKAMKEANTLTITLIRRCPENFQPEPLL